MQWEAITALASALSALVLAATVLFAARQVRATSAQMELARKSNQLDGMLRIMQQFDRPEFLASREFIETELDEKLRDPSYVRLLSDVKDQPWRPALVTLERLGVYIRFGYLDGEPFYYHSARVITQLWIHLHPLIEMHRAALDNPYLWKDTEWLAQDVQKYAAQWMSEHPLPRPSTGELFRPEHLLVKPPHPESPPLDTSGSFDTSG
jgi:hypothetical protein